MSMRARALACLGAWLSLSVAAEPADEAFPGLELLEFIGEWQADGEPVDPSVFLDEPSPAADEAARGDDDAP